MLRRKLSKSCAEDNILSISCSGEQRPKRYRTGVLNFWDFERIATLEKGNETLPAVVRDIPGDGSFVILNHKQADESCLGKSKLETSSKNTTKKVIPKKAATRRSSGKEDDINYSDKKELSSKDDQNEINDGFKKPKKRLKKVSQTAVRKMKNVTKFSNSVTLTNLSILKDEENSAHLNKKKSLNKKSTFSRSLFDNAKTCRLPEKNKDKQSMNEDNSNSSISSRYEELNVLNYSSQCLGRTSNSNCAPSKSDEISENESNIDVTGSSAFKKPSVPQKHCAKIEIVRPGQQKNRKLISDRKTDKAKRVSNSPQNSESKIVAKTKVDDLTLAEIKINSSENQFLNDPSKLSCSEITNKHGTKRVSNSSKQTYMFNDNNSISSSDFGYSSCSENIIKENAKQDLFNPAKKTCERISQPHSIDKLSMQFSGNKDTFDCQKNSTDRGRPYPNFSEACNDANNGNQNNKQSNESYNQMGRKNKNKSCSDETSQDCQDKSSQEFDEQDQLSHESDDQDQLSLESDDQDQLGHESEHRSNQGCDDQLKDQDSMRGEDLEFSEVSDADCTYRIARGLACDGLTPYMVSLLEGTLVFQTPSPATVVVIEGSGILEQLFRDKTVSGITVTLQRAAQFQASEGSILRLCKDDSSPQLNMCIILDEDA